MILEYIILFVKIHRASHYLIYLTKYTKMYKEVNMTDSDFKKLFGKRVKELRIKNGLTQEQLAEMIEVGERNLSKIECGNVFVKAKTITKLIDALKIEPQELFEFSQHKETEYLKTFLINEIKSDSVDIKMLYKIYRAIKY